MKTKTRTLLLALVPALFLFLNTATCYGGGFTLVVHGYSIGGTDDETWLDNYVSAIQSRANGSVTTVLEMDDHLTKSWGNIVHSVRYINANGPLAIDQTANGEVLLEINWSALASSEYEVTSSSDIAEQVVNYLLNHYPEFLQQPIHLIGHSRGGSVVSEISRLLGTYGIWVDQQTTLDPHPVNADGNIDWVWAVDASVKVYENTLFADNYWENTWITSGTVATYPAGETINSALNINLNSRFYLDNLPETYSADHSRVVDWYYGTINLSATTLLSDSGHSIPRSTWYTSAENSGANCGFINSRIGGGTRPVDGLNWRFGGSTSGQSITRNTAVGSQWPNVFAMQIVDSRFTSQTIPQFQIGETLNLQFQYQSCDSLAYSSLYLDTDQNPYNGNSVDILGSLISCPANGGNTVTAKSASWNTTGRLSGYYYLYVKIEDGFGHVRYIYAPKRIQLSHDLIRWTGGSAANSRWNNAENWATRVPASGDSLVFGGTERTYNTNDLAEGMLFAGITFTNGAGMFTLRGNGITLGGPLANLDNDLQTLEMPMTLSAESMINTSNGALTLGGLLNGSGGILKIGAGALALTGNNSFKGATTISNGLLAITHANALGSTNGNTVVRGTSGGHIQISGNITVAEPITLIGELPNYQAVLFNINGSNIWSGVITRVGNARIASVGGSTLVITGGVTGGGGYFCLNPSSGTFAFYNKPLTMGTDYFIMDQPGLTVMGVAGNTWGDTWVAAGTMKMEVANGLPAATKLQIGIGYAPGGTFDLNGFDQIVGGLYNGTSSSGTRIVISAAPATLTVNQSINTTYDGRLVGALSLVKAGSGKLTLSNNLSTTTGNITVSSGTLAVALDSSLGNSTNVVVAGGVLEIKTPFGISEGSTLTISDGAKVQIDAGLTEKVRSLILGDVAKGGGTWGATGSGAQHIDDAYFSGTGVIYVPDFTSTTPVPVPYKWLSQYQTLLSMAGGDYEAAALADIDGDGYVAWQEYLAGSNPTNRESVFRVFLTLSNGLPWLTWTPDLGTMRVYTVVGKTNLTDSIWEPTNAGSKFFRVKVSMP